MPIARDSERRQLTDYNHNQMPELPEVQTVVTTLKPLIVGKRIRQVVLYRTDILEPTDFHLAKALQHQTIVAVYRRGKRIVISLEDGNRFYIHLGMTGRLTVEKAGDPVLPHTHLIVGFGEEEMRFRDPRRFGGVWWLGRDDTSEKNMGPEPLTMRQGELLQQLSKTTRAIKNALLDQSVVAGLGNIYVDESLFAAGIHPLAAANELTAKQVGDLTRAIKSTLRKALRHRGSTLRDYFDANGTPGGFQKLHAVYDRAMLPCRNCSTAVARFVMGGRSTHYCPACQPANKAQLQALKSLTNQRNKKPGRRG